MELIEDIINTFKFIELHSIFSCNEFLERYGANTLKTWEKIADNVMIETISKDDKNKVFKIITDNFVSMVIDLKIEYSELTPYFYNLISEFREVFPIENREPQIRYFDKRLNLFYKNFGIDIENYKPDKTAQTVNNRPHQTKQPLTFAGLFKDVHIENLPAFKTAVISNGYTNEKVNLNVLAKIYYWLFDESYLTKQNDTKALKCFYNEFGVIVYKDTKPDTDKRTVTINNIRSQKPSYDEKKEYKNKLSNAFLKP